MLGDTHLPCGWPFGLKFASWFAVCCRPEVLREIAFKNQTEPGLNAGIARQRLPYGNPLCWTRTHVSYKACCSFTYQSIVQVGKGGARNSVHFLPWKSAGSLEVDLSPVVAQQVVIKQDQHLGSQFLMAGYPGVLWPDSLLLARRLVSILTRDTSIMNWHGRCLELAAGKFALPSIVLKSSQLFDDVFATDLVGVVDVNISRRYGFRLGELDMCDLEQIKSVGRFDFIVSSGGATQSNCGTHALVSLSTRETLVHMVVRSDVGDLERQHFLLENFFVELQRVDMAAAGNIQPSEAAAYVVWQRRFGPHSCWLESGFTYDDCCLELAGIHACFDAIYTKSICCGG